MQPPQPPANNTGTVKPGEHQKEENEEDLLPPSLLPYLRRPLPYENHPLILPPIQARTSASSLPPTTGRQWETSYYSDRQAQTSRQGGVNRQVAGGGNEEHRYPPLPLPLQIPDSGLGTTMIGEPSMFYEQGGGGNSDIGFRAGPELSESREAAEGARREASGTKAAIACEECRREFFSSVVGNSKGALILSA